jgi:hypothetical protein
MAQSLLSDAQLQETDSLDARSDLDLIAAINSGDASAFEILYRRHRDWAIHLALRFTGDGDAALDVMQESFLYFLRKFSRISSDRKYEDLPFPAGAEIEKVAILVVGILVVGNGLGEIFRSLPAAKPDALKNREKVVVGDGFEPSKA